MPPSLRRRYSKRAKILFGVAAFLVVANAARYYVTEVYLPGAPERDRIRAEATTNAYRDQMYVQTLKLPSVDRVEIFHLGSERVSKGSGYPIRPYGDWVVILKKGQLTGERAAELAQLWRTRKFGGGQALCHEPVYGLRFFAGQKQWCETSVCWMCSNIYLMEPSGNYCWVGFSDPDLELLNFLKGIIPLPETSKSDTSSE